VRIRRFLLGSVVIASLLVAAPRAVADGEGDGHHTPFNQDPGSGGPSGGDPCSFSINGTCRYSGIYPDGFDCAVAWCEADPAASTKCASHNEPTCQQGEDANGDPIYVMVNWCSVCAR
jgi:hypothetical protein